MRRLTGKQFRNSVQDFVAYVTKNANVAAAVLADPDVAASLQALPADVRPLRNRDDLSGDFRRLDQNIHARWVEATAIVAEKVGLALAQPTALGTIAPCTGTATGSAVAACVDSVINTLGARALRLPQLSPALLTFYRGVYGNTDVIDKWAFADLLGAFIGSPQFAYMVEKGNMAAPVGPGRYLLTAGELATRLSLGFWDTVPDDQLWESAKSGSLLSADGYRRELDRIIADPRARAATDTFFSEWLQLDLAARLPLEALKMNPRYVALLGATTVQDLPTRTALNDETLDFVRYIVWTKGGSGGTFDDLLTSDAATIRDAAAARFFGMSAPWDGTSVPPSFPAGTRPGLLTRPGILAKDTTGTATSTDRDTKTQPVRRGAFVRQEILCDLLPPHPPNAFELAAELRAMGAYPATSSTRKQWEYLTESYPMCKTCHQASVNPLGFAFEGYDALGRVRADEPIFNAAGTAIVARVPIDTNAIPQVVLGDQTPVSGAAGLVKLFQSTNKAATCFTRAYYWRYLLGRGAAPSIPNCADDLAKAKPTLRDLFKQMATTSTFLQRNLP